MRRLVMLAGLRPAVEPAPSVQASEAVEVARNTVQAVDVARKGLEVLERRQLAPPRRESLEQSLKGRLKRLGTPSGSQQRGE